jgi:hypothetical protein
VYSLDWDAKLGIGYNNGNKYSIQERAGEAENEAEIFEIPPFLYYYLTTFS